MMTNQQFWQLYEKYLGCWKAISAEQRSETLDELIAQDIHYRTARHNSGGREDILADMAAFQQKFPGGRFDVGAVSSHHDLALLTWVLVQADGKVFTKGHDQICVSPDGKIQSLITFPPPVSTP